MSSIFYNGTPIEEVDFEKEFNKELQELTDKINELKTKKYTNKKINYEYWALKLLRANRELEVGKVTIS